MKQQVALSKIVLDAGTQVRDKLDEPTIEAYAEAMLAIARNTHLEAFPAVVIFLVNGLLILCDGFHRVHAAIRAGYETILAEIREGTMEEAIECALRANHTNSLRRTTADKRKSIHVALERFGERSDRHIADLCGVDHKTVADVRITVGKFPTNGETRVGADGVKQPARKRTRKSLPRPVSPQRPEAPMGGELPHPVPSAPEVPEPEATPSEAAPTDASGTPAPETTPERTADLKTETPLRTTAHIYVQQAIKQLEHIRPDDPSRVEEVRELDRWIHVHILDSAE